MKFLKCKVSNIGLDVIKRVGIGGTFLAEDHTLKYMRETLFFSKIFDRRMVSSWVDDRKGMLVRAKERVLDLLKKNEPIQRLTSEQIAELDRIITTAQSALGGSS